MWAITWFVAYFVAAASIVFILFYYLISFYRLYSWPHIYVFKKRYLCSQCPYLAFFWRSIQWSLSPLFPRRIVQCLQVVSWNSAKQCCSRKVDGHCDWQHNNKARSAYNPQGEKRARGEHDGQTHKEQFCERRDDCRPYMLIPGNQDKVEPEIENQCYCGHYHNLLLVFYAYQRRAEHTIDVKEEQTRSESL